MRAHSGLEKRFLWTWETVRPRIPLESELRFSKSRRWRFDFAHPTTLVAIEIEGGTWSNRGAGGAHNRGAGFERDLEKYLHAALLGWTVFRLGEKQITTPIITKIAAFIRATQ